MEIVAIPKIVMLECRSCGCRISVKHDEFVKVIKGNEVQLCPCCNENDLVKIGFSY